MAALGLVVLVSVFIAVALPRASLDYRTRALHRALRTAPVAETALLADADITDLIQGDFSTPLISLDDRQARFDEHRLASGLRRAGLPLANPAAWWAGVAAAAGVLSGAPKPPPGTMQPPQLVLFYRSTLARNARLVAGTMPTRAHGTGISETFQVAVTAATAARLGLRVGSRLAAAGQALVVTGIIRPTNPESSFWAEDPRASAPRLTYPGPDSAPFLSTAAFVGGAELPTLETHVDKQQLDAQWCFPLALRGVTADQAPGLLQKLQRLITLPVAVGDPTSASPPLEVDWSAGLATTDLPSLVAADEAVQRALSPLFVSLAALAAVVVLLAVMLVTEHRRGEFALLRARGATSIQVAIVALRGAAAGVLPAAALAVAVGVLLTPGPGSLLAVWLGIAVAGTAVVGPPLLAAWQVRPRRTVATAGRRRIELIRRWVIDAALVCASVGGLIALRQQGLPPPGQLDVLVSLAPLLAAVPIALLIVRCYPLVLGRLTRLTRRRRGTVMVVGFARGRAAARETALPAFALILAVALVAFASMARDAVSAADVAASWQATPADAVVTAPATGPGLTPAAVHDITRVSGARRVASISVETATTSGGQLLPVAIVNPQRYAALVAASPNPRFPAGLLAAPRVGSGTGGSAEVPALVSAAGRTVLGQGSTLVVSGRRLAVRVTGQAIPEFAGVAAGTAFAVLPTWAFGDRVPQPTVLAIQGPNLDTGALLRAVNHAVPGAQLTLRSRLLAGITGAPLPHGGLVTLVEGAVAAGALALLVLLFVLMLSARSREMALTRLATMGLDPRQSRWIAAVETLPVIVSAAVGGTACALALVPLVGSAVDLAAFTGSPQTVPLHVDPLALGAAAGGLLLLAAVTLFLQDRLAHRHDISQALRGGE